MANCNDCICSEVCYFKSFNDVRTLKKRRNDVEKICKSFVHRDSLKNAPTVDAVEVVHGRWEPVDHDGSWRVDRCSICNRRMHYVDYDQPYQYCPNCGAKMDGEKNES